MFSGDGEYVDLLHSVLLEGPVEVSCGEGRSVRPMPFPLGEFARLRDEGTSLGRDIGHSPPPENSSLCPEPANHTGRPPSPLLPSGARPAAA